jgi:glycosyltransferase involved in cell wall biosynthesis
MSVSPGTLLPPPAVHRAAPRAAALPLISVVTPSFNQGRFIERCIRSVLAQNYPRCEHIVQDNCSTDETLAVLRRYPHVQWVSAPDRGQSDALNRALARARGEIIAWIPARSRWWPANCGAKRA